MSTNIFNAMSTATMIPIIIFSLLFGVALDAGTDRPRDGTGDPVEHGTITVPGGFPVVAMFLATTPGLPFEAVGPPIAVDWFAGIFRTFLNENGDTFVAMLVANPDSDIDRDDVYNGTKTVHADKVDLADLKDQLARADAAD